MCGSRCKTAQCHFAWRLPVFKRSNDQPRCLSKAQQMNKNRFLWQVNAREGSQKYSFILSAKRLGYWHRFKRNRGSIFVTPPPMILEEEVSRIFVRSTTPSGLKGLVVGLLSGCPPAMATRGPDLGRHMLKFSL